MSHCLEVFLYCPRCGSNKFVINNEKSKHCSDCGFTYYANPSSATVAVIFNDKNELLVARRAKDPAKGTLDLVGGFVDMDESAEQGLLREIFEETSLRVSDPKYLFSIPNIYHYSGMDIHTLDMFYECRVSSLQSFKAQDDVSELFFVPIDKVNPQDFGLMSIRKGVEIILREKTVK